jgi:ATP adenylyltransferase
MSDEQPNAEWKRNIWAPWRIEYIESLCAGGAGCFLCEIREAPERDDENLLIWRGRRCLTVLNRFPYTGGHSLVAPLEHLPSLADIDAEAVLEMMAMVRDVQQAISRAIRAQGFNIGINIGRCAGAGLPGHLHVHVVPRWPGDTNFMHVFGDVRVIPDALEKLRDKIRQAAEELNLPALARPTGGADEGA